MADSEKKIFKSPLERLSLKAQILVAYSLMAAVVCVISIVLSTVMYDKLNTSVNSDSRSTLLSQSLTNAQTLAGTIAETAAQQLTTLGNSVNKVTSSYSRTLLTTTDPTRPTPKVPPYQLLAKARSYPAFNFTAGCAETDSCPSDYGPLSTRSRFPKIPYYENGSLLHSSVSVYNSVTQQTVSNMSDWDAAFASSQAMSDVRDAFALQDEDFRVMFANNGSFISYLFNIAKVTDSSGQYYSFFSTYPGLGIYAPGFDAVQTPVFVGESSETIRFFGPYFGGFIQQRGMFLSVQKSFPYLDRTVDVVSVATVNVESFRELITSIPYVNGGYAVVYNSVTQQVIAWGNRTDFVDAQGNFLFVRNMDPNLPATLCAEPTFEYMDAAGTEWLAGCSYSFVSSVFTPFGNIVSPTLTVIVFARKDLALMPLDAMQVNMDDSAAAIGLEVLILVLGLSFVVLLLVFAAVWNITAPLDTMRRVALEVIDVMAEDEEVRDFAPVLNKAGFNVSRTDEVGVLACDFYQVMCLMHNKVVAKHATAKYPPNPWRMECEEEVDEERLSQLTWQDLRSVVSARPAQLPVGDLVVRDNFKGSEISSATQPTASSKVVMMSTKVFNKVSNAARMHISGKVKPLEVDQLATISTSKPVGWLTCLKTQLSTLAGILVAGVVGAMLVTVLTVQEGGNTWSSTSADGVTATQAASLYSIAVAKAAFVTAFYAQMTMDISTAGASFTSLLMGEVTSSSWEVDGDYLHSYSLDTANPHSLNPHGAVYPFSSYYRSTDANCSSSIPHTCDTTRNSTQSRLTSLLDMKMESLFYHNSYLSSIHTAHDDSGYVRFWPMRYSAAYSVPTKCWPQATDIQMCVDQIQRSKCGNASAQTYPPYDPRCRSWYALARQYPTAGVPVFTHPADVDGRSVITSVMNVVNETTGARLGAITMDFSVSPLEAGITRSPIMTLGYGYLVDLNNVDNVVLHPQRTTACQTVQCVEGMSASEYAVLKSTVLLAGSRAAGSYAKGGQSWRVATSPVQYGRVSYLLVATVPDSEVVAFANNAHDTIDESSQSMVQGFGIAIAVVVTCMIVIIANMVRLIMKPLDNLREVIRLALMKDFTKELPKQAGSSDMAALMDAITQLLVALRLESSSGESADIKRTHAVFVDSVNLFQATGNRKGRGASLSNLAALELAMGNSTTAKEHYMRSIELAKEHVAQVEAASAGGAQSLGGDLEAAQKADDLRRARRVVSDRQGGLALALLEQRDLAAATKLLDQVLLDDKRNLHIRGCIIKQSMLGQVYLRLKQLADAEQVFAASLVLVREMQNSSAVRGSAMSEADACEMLALCDMAALTEARNWRTSLETIQALERKYLEALMTPAHMELSTARRLLRSLMALYGRHPQFSDAKRLVQSIADAHKLSLAPDAVEGMAVARRVVLVVDYSSSMAGSRIRSMKDAMHAFMKEHLRGRDSVCILSFNNSVQEVLPLTAKGGNAMHMAKRVEALAAPVGGTALYDGVLRALKVLQQDSSSSDWVVVLADGKDDKSKCSLPQVLTEVTASRVSVVALGIGPDAPEDVLQCIAQASPRGFSTCLPATKVDISDLFDEVARVLQSTQVTLEEY